MNKVKSEDSFLDLSDYGRPLASVLVRLLLHTRVTPVQITLAFTAVGLLAAWLYAAGDGWIIALAGILLLVKSTLDAADGALARARQQPSRVGRFLDSIMDFVVNVAVIGAIAWAMSRNSGSYWPFALAVVALVSMTLQGSYFNFHYVQYRHATGGDTTSRLDERVDISIANGNRRILAVLLVAYSVIYGWQDRWMAWLERWSRPGRPPTGALTTAVADKRFLTATTALGLGSHLMIICLWSLAGRPDGALWMLAGPANLYWAGLIIFRRLSQPRQELEAAEPLA